MKRMAMLGLAMLTMGAARPPVHTCTPGPYIVFFDHESSAIKKDAAEILDNAIQNEGDCGAPRAVLAGHSDTSEPRAIAGRRLLAVANYLAARGVFVRRGDRRNFGAREPRVKTPPNTEERQNRRVELTYGPDV